VLGGRIRKEKGKDCPQMEPSTGVGEACLLKIRDREATYKWKQTSTSKNVETTDMRKQCVVKKAD